jgi:hypothetical protein
VVFIPTQRIIIQTFLIHTRTHSPQEIVIINSTTLPITNQVIAIQLDSILIDLPTIITILLIPITYLVGDSIAITIFQITTSITTELLILITILLIEQ